MKSNKRYWEETLNRYRASKRIRVLREKFNIRLKDIADNTGYSKQYINNVQEIIIKPSKNFLSKLERLEHVESSRRNNR